MKVIFRVDASIKIGTGHVMRCLALAQVLKDNGYKVEFICRKHKGNLINKLHSLGLIVHELEVFKEVDTKLLHSNWLGSTQKQDAESCIDILKNEKIDWLVVDHYAIDEQWQNRLKKYCKKLMVIDDLADRKHQCDVLLDQTYGRQQKDYSKLIPKGCELLLGSEYALLRPEFAKWRQYSIERRSSPELKQLLINMGGIDENNVTNSILDEIKTSILPNNIDIVVVMGGLAPHLKSVKSKANTLPYKTEVKVDVCNMSEIMANSDIAIGAAGSSTWERCCLGLPTIQIVIAKNQQFLAEALDKKNAIKLVEDIKGITQLLQSPFAWIQHTSNAALGLCDGRGSYKLFNKMTNYKMSLDQFGEVEMCNYVNLKKSEKTLILSMRNHPKIKKWMYNQSSILEKDHFLFIESLKERIDRRYFLVKHKNHIIGSINFSEIDLYNSVEFGIYTNPFLKLKNAGGILESAASQYAFAVLNVNKIKLEVFSDNKRAINFYNKRGFKFINIKKVNQKDIVCMEKHKRTEQAH